MSQVTANNSNYCKLTKKFSPSDEDKNSNEKLSGIIFSLARMNFNGI